MNKVVGVLIIMAIAIVATIIYSQIMPSNLKKYVVWVTLVFVISTIIILNS